MAPWLIYVKANGCGALPRDVERSLMAASRVGTPDSMARRRAIDVAYRATSRAHPDLFKY